MLASFADVYTGNTPSDFTATINWGDGTTTAGTVAGGNGIFTVSGSHTYTSAGQDTVTVTLADDAPGTATASAISTVNVNPVGNAVRMVITEGVTDIDITSFLAVAPSPASVRSSILIIFRKRAIPSPSPVVRFISASTTTCRPAAGCRRRM